MRPNSRQLALRDPALAAILGLVGGPSADFGHSAEAEFGGEFGHDYAQIGADMGREFAGDMGADYGAEYGAEYGGEFGRDHHRRHMSPAQQAAIAAHNHRKMRSHSRNLLLDPNNGSDIKVERYAFSINQTLMLGTSAGLDLTGQPDTTIRPQQVTMNAPQSGFVTVTEIKVANVSVTVGGASDAFEYNPVAVNSHLDMPTLTPANRATVLGSYTGFVPPGYVSGSAYLFVTTFKGPATITG